MKAIIFLLKICFILFGDQIVRTKYSTFRYDVNGLYVIHSITEKVYAPNDYKLKKSGIEQESAHPRKIPKRLPN